VIFEEISTPPVPRDSFYEDKSIGKGPYQVRKTVLLNWRYFEDE
jgi:hypothetical protein